VAPIVSLHDRGLEQRRSRIVLLSVAIHSDHKAPNLGRKSDTSSIQPDSSRPFFNCRQCFQAIQHGTTYQVIQRSQATLGYSLISLSEFS
jgi:hypothetical protein